MDNPTEAIMKRRFHELGRQREAIVAVSSPLRAEYEAMVARHQAELAPVMEAMKEAEKGLYEIDRERGQLTRFFRDENGVARMGEPTA